MFVLESLEHATARGAKVLAEVVGASSSPGRGSLTGPDPAGTAAARAVRQCLRSSAPGTSASWPTARARSSTTRPRPPSRPGPCPRPGQCAPSSPGMGHLASFAARRSWPWAWSAPRPAVFPAIANPKPVWPDLPCCAAPWPCDRKTCFRRASSAAERLPGPQGIQDRRVCGMSPDARHAAVRVEDAHGADFSAHGNQYLSHLHL